MSGLVRDPRAPFEFAPPVPWGRRDTGHDWLLTATALALSLIGAVLVWAATRDLQRAQHADPQAFLYRHLLNIAVAAALLVIASRVDARLLRMLGPIVYVGSVLGLVLVLVAGTRVNGARAWIDVGGGFQLQPAEFMKLGMVVGMAVLFTQRAAARQERSERFRAVDGSPTTGDILLALGLVAVPAALIMLQPDLGSCMVLAAAGFGVLVAAGVPARWTVGLLVLAVVASVVAVQAGVLHGYQLQRVTSFTNPNHDPQGAAYNVTQARIAIAGGGLFGTGLFQGPQTNGGYVPEQQTDFVFSVAGEEFGLVGGVVIIALFALLCWRALCIARLADPTGRVIAAGIVCWFGFQTFQNIGMNLSLMPVTGLPLPFVSYGGSSMFAEALAIGLLQAIRRASV